VKPRAPGALLLTLALCAAGCGRTDPNPKATAPETAAPTPTTPDRLPPGELLEGEARAFGLVLPRLMAVESATKRTVHARGRVRPETLANYLRARVSVQHVEMADKRLTFPKAQLRGDPNGTVLRLEVIDEGLSTHLIVRNLMGPPLVPGLSNEQRWEQAGRKPGGPLDPHQLE
jgi:hypothetical protein